MDNFCIVVTGLPGSGKSTIGKIVAEKLNLPMLDKDDYLERLFEEQGIGDLAWRQKLSRESDKLFQRDAMRLKTAVLVSHWRPRGLNSTSGTPTEWLDNHYAHVIELFCRCSVEEAAKRFVNRARHPGHQDGLKSHEEIVAWMHEYNKLLPLVLGKLEAIETELNTDIDQLIGRLTEYIQSSA